MHTVTKDTPCTMIQSLTAHPVVKQVYIKGLKPKVCNKSWGYKRKVEYEWFYLRISHCEGALTVTRSEDPVIKLSRLSHSHRLHTILLRVVGIHPPPPRLHCCRLNLFKFCLQNRWVNVEKKKHPRRAKLLAIFLRLKLKINILSNLCDYAWVFPDTSHMFIQT